MRMGFQIAGVVAMIGIAAISAPHLFAQAAAKPAPSKTASSYTPPRTADGQPDLGGFWNTASLTPLQRTPQFAGKAFFTPAEADAYEKARLADVNRDRRDGGFQADLDRAYNEAWFDRGTKVARTLRTSLISDPPDGKVPALTPSAKDKFETRKAQLAVHPADGPEDRPLPDRCLQFSQVGPPMFPGNYNDNYSFVQAPGYVAIQAEMGNVVRVIPLDNSPHAPKGVRTWTGDPRGHWEGNTLVVDSTNFVAGGWDRFGVVFDGPTDENLHVIERFTRTVPDMILYQATVDDPSVYTKPWTVEIAMNKVEGPVFEYACHEGNYGMSGILAGERAKEKKASGH